MDGRISGVNVSFLCIVIWLTKHTYAAVSPQNEHRFSDAHSHSIFTHTVLKYKFEVLVLEYFLLLPLSTSTPLHLRGKLLHFMYLTALVTSYFTNIQYKYYVFTKVFTFTEVTFSFSMRNFYLYRIIFTVWY